MLYSCTENIFIVQFSNTIQSVACCDTSKTLYDYI